MSLHCTGCGYENDPTRVYCHNCGQKLERSEEGAALPGGFTPPQAVQEAKAPRRRRSLALGSYFYALLKLAILAAVVFMVALALLPPKDLPVPVAADEARAASLSETLKRASASRSAVAFKFPAADVNNWLIANAHFKPSQSPIALRPERVYSVLGNGTVRIGLETALPGAGRLCFEADYMPIHEVGGQILRPSRFSIGRLILPVLLGWPVQRQFDGLAGALEVPLEQLARASEIQVAPDAVTLRWSGNAR